jgi:hypothetical protein
MPVIKKHQTLLDYVVEQGGSIMAWFDVARLNDFSLTEDVAAGVNAQVISARLIPVEATIAAPIQQPKGIVLKKHQTLIDFTTQHAGTIESMIKTALLNAISITDEVAEGTQLAVEVADQRVVNVFVSKFIDVVSTKKASEVQPGGIGYMQIQNNFIVS